MKLIDNLRSYYEMETHLSADVFSIMIKETENLLNFLSKTNQEKKDISFYNNMIGILN